MALRKIIIDGDPALRKASRPVEAVNDRIKTLIDDMIETMYENNGIGLAAVQVGVLRRIFVMDIQDGSGVHVMVNPEIVEREGSQMYMEGCLSVPGCAGEVERPARLVIRAMDRDGQPFEMEAEGLKAVCISHENDHLDGVLFTDKVKGDLIRE
ncbi:MAG: peptide deformylase [Eubacteriales bacterium]|nr:peptide deformylase [Eubacteriales bacterium]